MKQVVLRNGQPLVADTPRPAPQVGRLLVANHWSVISSGTERASISSAGGGNSLAIRAIRNPDLVLKTLNHARKHGISETRELVRGAVTDDIAVGYSSAGVVLETGQIPGFTVGDRVACAGAGHANHAEVVSVPANLAAKVPPGVELRDAAFTTLGAIAMQGVRRLQPQLGDRIVVVGLGLLGLITVQLLRATGVQVIGVEPNERRRGLGEELGADHCVTPGDAGPAISTWSEGYGADGVIVCAAGKTSSIINQAVTFSRRKGKIVAVGDVGLDIDRGPLYQRELDFLISTSYGPGRYDKTYEEDGIDYPLPYVRWTENRNMEEFLRLLGNQSVKVDELIDIEHCVDDATEAYAKVNSDSPPLAAVLAYPETNETAACTGGSLRVTRSHSRRSTAANHSKGVPSERDIVVGLIGTGSFARGVHLPNLKRLGETRIKSVASQTGLSANNVARSLKGDTLAGSASDVIDDPEIDLVIVTTRHDSHAEIASAALRAGKAVFLEKPLGVTREEIDELYSLSSENDRLIIGFNRPFSPLAQTMNEQLTDVAGPIQLSYRVSAPLPAGHWLNDPTLGGGRILGEACHMFDFCSWLCGTPTSVYAAALPFGSTAATVESVTIVITYQNGSVATLQYVTVGGSTMPKEMIEVFKGGQSWVLDDFRKLIRYGDSGSDKSESSGQDKGHLALMSHALAAVRGQAKFKPGIAEGYVAQSIGLAALESLATGSSVAVQLSPTVVREDALATIA